jgi:KUP system potassium uptake protein
MKNPEVHQEIKRLSVAGAILTLGIVFGNLGTSPLYTIKAIVTNGSEDFNPLLIYGGLSCIFWTLTLSTTIKYVLITLKTDNNGEGGFFALAALIREKSSWLAILTMIGGSALLADGVITPAITLTSSIEGLKLHNPGIPVVPVVLIILAVLFFIQQFGTNLIGNSFGPIMFIWFTTLAVLGFYQVLMHPAVLQAVNPVYAYQFLSEYPGGFVLLGAVFLCTTGAGALYTNLGYCGKSNIRVTWGFVKIALLLNYFGQGAWLMTNIGKVRYVNPFFEIMPEWFLIPGIIIAVVAAIIASQAIISGAFTIVSEAISMNLWPWLKVMHKTIVRGQVYVPFVNWFLWIACSLTVIIFKESSNMITAYGLAVIITEIMTTVMLSYYLLKKGLNHRLVMIMFMTYLTIEGSFLIANLHKLMYGGWFTLILGSIYFLIMYGWYFGRKIKTRYITFADLDKHLTMFRDLSRDDTIPKFATNIVYIIHADRHDQVESKVIYSIFYKQPKRANTYWFLRINSIDEPDRFNYKVSHIIPGLLIRIDFNIGFKIEPKINLYFREVLEDLEKSGEINLQSCYDSLKKHGHRGDFVFVDIDRMMSRDFTLSHWENFVLSLHSLVRRISITDNRMLNLDPTNTIIEKVPILVDQPVSERISRKKS